MQKPRLGTGSKAGLILVAFIATLHLRHQSGVGQPIDSPKAYADRLWNR